MLKISVSRILGLVVVVVFGCVAAYYCLTDSATKVEEKRAKTEAKKESPKIEQKKEKPAPEGSLTFWSGEIIIGNGDNCGQIELFAHEGRKSIVLTVDDDGKYQFDSIPLMKKGEIYIRLQDEYQPPLISLAEFKDGEEMKMHPVFQLTRRYKAGAFTPRFAPDIESPVEVKGWQKGQFFEGATWTFVSRRTQLYGEGK